MADPRLGAVIRHLRTLSGDTPGGAATDQELLERFLHDRDPAAFTALVRRHGPLVWGVCRRLVQQPCDAEDAFQATFLILLRNARSIGSRPALASWLHGVAYRVATRLRQENFRILNPDSRLPGRTVIDPGLEAAWRELSALLDGEVQALPEKYRAPLVLCYLEGRTRDQAARQLGWSLRTLDRRLAQGKDLLRGRLTRRGVALSAALLSAGLAGPATAAPSPAALAQAVARFASLALAGPVEKSRLLTVRAAGRRLPITSCLCQK
jgi:RNA polymerase sigma factor (sigma-70 family)